MEAAKTGMLRMVQVLVGKGANLAAKDREGNTALDLAASQGRFLKLEIVELDRAEVLAERTLTNSVDPRFGVSVRAADLAAAAEALRIMLQEALAQVSMRSGRKVIAPLFFKNIDPAPRLDSYEQDLAELLHEEAAQTKDLLVVRFPRAMESRSESELALLGLVDAGLESWKTVADTLCLGNPQGTAFTWAPFCQGPG
jgi:ankyrin repeat protein